MQSDLPFKYGPRAFEAGRALQPESFERRVAMRDALDQHFTKSWLDFAVNGILQRPALDTRTRLLVLTGQFTMAKSHPALCDTIKAGLLAQVPAREILEIILQCAVYGGHTTVDPAIEVFYRVAEEDGLLEELKKDQLPLDGTDSQRSYDRESKLWHPDDVADARLPGLIERHGWLAVGRGLTMRPRHHLNVLSWLDTMDSQFADLWVKFCYGAMYTRGVVDDKTRLLCMIGDCLAIAEETQARGHMRGALRQGAHPREIMEVCFQTAVNFGMPPMLKALEVFVQVMAEDKRLDEIGNPPLRVESYGK
ncbi:MAG TPA: carboxymuconolactone decarboxylase family protein [Burkholderiales bacterium]|nr:carboxymuconolactone decarboxylase family protein [Burkholderiales bacterium]